MLESTPNYTTICTRVNGIEIELTNDGDIIAIFRILLVVLKFKLQQNKQFG